MAFPFNSTGNLAPFCLWPSGDGETCFRILRGTSRLKDSYCECAARCGLRDRYRCSRGGSCCFSGGEGVGLREDTCVIVGETAT